MEGLRFRIPSSNMAFVPHFMATLTRLSNALGTMGKKPSPIEHFLFAITVALVWFTLLFLVELSALCVYVSLWVTPLEILKTAIRVFPSYVYTGFMAGLCWGAGFFLVFYRGPIPYPNRKWLILGYCLSHLLLLMVGLVLLDFQILLPEWKLAGLYLIATLLCFAIYRLGRFLFMRLLSRPSLRDYPMRRSLPVMGVLLLLAVGIHLFSFLSETGCPGPETSAEELSGEKKPNIVLIVMDTVRPDHLSCYGYHRNTTPFLKRLAAEGIVFDNVVSTSPWTLPSHASMFSGLYPSQHGATHANLNLSGDLDLLSEILAKAGYQTVGFSANPWVGQSTGMHQGFHVLKEVWRDLFTDGFFSLVRISHSMAGTVLDQGAGRILEEGQLWLHRCYDPASPVFFFANFMDAHSPYSLIPPDYRHMYQQDAVKEDRMKQLDRERRLHLYGERILEPDEFEILEGLYDGGIRYLDGRLEDLEALLSNHGLAADRETLWIFTSDHGENFGEHGLVDHEFAVNEALIRVALILRFPGRIAAGTRCASRVQNMDLFSTILDAAGLEDVDKKESLGLIPPPDGGQRRHFEVAEYFRPELLLKMARRQGHDASRYDRALRTILRGDWKYVWASDGADELYELDQDPNEEENLVEIRPERAELLREELDHWLAHVGAKGKQGVNGIKADPILEERLKSLGYMQ
jgi:arylsulfatase A-like enzyme